MRVRAAGLNNADLLQVRGGYPAPAGVPADIPGLELAGEVVALGPNATRFSIGDRVMAVVGGGAQAQLAVFHERTAMPVPDSMSWSEAGGFAEVFTTAHDALVTQCAMTAGDRVLVHGAAGGVGVAGVQLAVAFGASVVATVRDPSRWAEVSALGAEVTSPEAFVNRGPYDIVLELIGASNLEENLRALKIGGRITVIGVGGTGPVGEINLLTVMMKRATVRGSTLRTRPLEEKADAARRVERQVLPLVETGRIRVPVHATFALREVAAAYEHFAAGSKFGKIVLVDEA